MPQAIRRAPGIHFDAQPPRPEIVLPRMDVAGFVGYAAAGPVDVPVPVEDAARFAEVFGSDLPVAFDPRRGETVNAALAPAVRSFFRNGGRRCIVLRVADSGARATAFQLPGVVALTEDGPRHALLRARSVGSWADTLRVAVSVASAPLVLQPVSVRDGTFDLAEAHATARAGDLIRLELGGWTLLAAVTAVAGARIATGPRLWLQPAPLVPGASFRARWIGATGVEQSATAEVTTVAGRSQLRVGATLERGPAEGALVRLGHDALWARVDERARDGARVLLTCTALRLRHGLPPGLPRSRARRAAERLELELWTEGATRDRLGGLGFGLGHPRFVGDLPVDEDLYADATGPLPGEQPELWRAAGNPRFPLAGPETRPLAYLPLAASLLPRPWLAALPPGGTQRRRDGLERFRPAVFLDERLAPVRTPALLAAADHLRYGSGTREPARLHGLHGLLGVEEISMVAVPDAALPGWTAPTAGTAGPPVVEAHTEAPVPGAFASCRSTDLTPPRLRVTGDPASGAYGLDWDTPPAGAVIEVGEATDAGFETAALIYRGTRTEVELGGRPPGAHWYRARFVAGEAAGPFAAAGPVGSAARPPATVRRPDQYSNGVLVSVHRALLRMCAARGDVLALLALPEHYREDEAIGHATVLRTGRTAVRVDAPALGEGEERALSSAALYHPWLVATSEDRPEELRRVPPEGAMAGVAARRAVERGAWVAPANVTLLDVVALSPELAPERRLDLLEAQVDVVERTPRGFLCFGADTLAEDPDLRLVNVRRLLSLLRRLALRHGEVYTFEPDGEVLRRSAQRGFEAILDALFALGAFAGMHPEEGFQVVTDSTAEGRLVVELKVAPARPLAFLTIRLVRAGDGRLGVETVG